MDHEPEDVKHGGRPKVTWKEVDGKGVRSKVKS